MSEFNERELLLLINSTHERAMRLLDLSNEMSQVGFRSSIGKKPTKEDIDSVFNGHKEHLALVEKLRTMKNT